MRVRGYYAMFKTRGFTHTHQESSRLRSIRHDARVLMRYVV